MGKQIYLSEKEAEWIVNMIDYFDAPIKKEDEKIIISILNKAKSVTGKMV